MHTNIQAIHYGVATGPVSVAVEDLNKDGNLDIVTANYLANTVSVLFGNPAGTFSPAPNSPYPVGSGPHSVAIADLNRDGNLDIVTANYGAHSVSVLLGNSVGTFAPAPNSPYAVGTHPISVAIGDLNKDGNLDIVTANYGAHSVSVLFGNSVGTFALSTNSPYTVGINPYSIAIADLNEDGHLDIATANYGAHSVSALFGNSVGTFAPASNSPYTVGTNPRSIAIADLNRDGYLDMVIANSGSNSVSVFLGNAVGSFAQSTNSPYSVGAKPLSVAIADLDKDGYLDIVTANHDSNSVSVLLGNIAGTFFSAPNSPYSVGTNPYLVAIADLNKDNNLDLVIANYGAHTVSVLYGTIDGPFSQSMGKFIDQELEEMKAKVLKLEDTIKNLSEGWWVTLQSYVYTAALATATTALLLLKKKFDEAKPAIQKAGQALQLSGGMHNLNFDAEQKIIGQAGAAELKHEAKDTITNQ